MKLTNYLRDAFVRSVMQEVPAIDYDLLAKQLQDALYSGMSADVRRVYRKTPNALKVQGFWFSGDRYQRKSVVGDADFDLIFPQYNAVPNARDDFQHKLKKAVNGFTTVKQVRDAYPELAHHLPDEKVPTKNLPAQANLIAELVLLGWESKVKGEA